MLSKPLTLSLERRKRNDDEELFRVSHGPGGPFLTCLPRFLSGVRRISSKGKSVRVSLRPVWCPYPWGESDDHGPNWAKGNDFRYPRRVPVSVAGSWDVLATVGKGGI